MFTTIVALIAALIGYFLGSAQRQFEAAVAPEVAPAKPATPEAPVAAKPKTVTVNIVTAPAKRAAKKTATKTKKTK